MTTGTIILFAAFGGIVVIMIAIAIAGTKKDKNTRVLEGIDRQERFEDAGKYVEDLWVKLGVLATWVSTNSEKVKKDPSKARYTLSEINKKSNDVLDKVLDKEKLDVIYSVDSYSSLLKPVIKNINKTRPSSWETKSHFEYNIIESKYNNFKAIDSKKVETIENDFKKEFNL